MHFHKILHYDKKNLKTQEIVNDKWYKKDNDRFTDLIDIIDINKLISEFNIIL